MAEEKSSNSWWPLAGYIAGAIVVIAGLCMGLFGEWDSTTWWTIGTGVVVALLGACYQFKVLEPTESK